MNHRCREVSDELEPKAITGGEGRGRKVCENGRKEWCVRGVKGTFKCEKKYVCMKRVLAAVRRGCVWGRGGHQIESVATFLFVVRPLDLSDELCGHWWQQQQQQ